MCVDNRPSPATQAQTQTQTQTQGPLSQKVALVTSSAPGLCADTARQLAGAGAKVIVCGRDATQGLATVREIRSLGGRATFVLADIAVTADVQNVIDETIATYGRLDILFNNVSNSYARDNLLTDVSEAVWDRLVEPLLKGTFFCCQYALPFLQQSSSGTIINLVEQTTDSSNDSVSTICQGGVLALTGAIAHQFATRSITINLIWATHALAIAEEGHAEGHAAEQPPSTSLLLPNILTGPPKQDRPFASIAEAVMYLACHGSHLNGTALIVKS